MSDLCIACGKVFGKRQQGVTCDVCDRFQHRICGTGNNYFIIRYILKDETLWFVYVNIVHVCFCLFKLLARPLQLPALYCFVNKKQIKPLSFLHTGIVVSCLYQSFHPFKLFVRTGTWNSLRSPLSKIAYENTVSYHYDNTPMQ